MRKKKLRERQRLQKVTERLSRDLDAVVVEGRADRKVVEELGFEGEIIESAEKSVEDLAEVVKRRADVVAVLTDFDSHGKYQAEKISRRLSEDVDVLSSARKEFGAELTQKDRYAVEDAAPLLESKEKKFVDAFLDRIF